MGKKVFIFGILIAIVLGLVTANHITYTTMKGDIDEIVDSVRDRGIGVEYDLNYGVMIDGIVDEKVYLNNVVLNFKETNQEILIDRVGLGEINLIDLDIQLSVEGLSLPVGIFYDEGSMNPMIQLYFNALENIDINTDTVLNTDFYVSAEDDGFNNLSLELGLDIERLLAIDLDLGATGFNPIELSSIMLMDTSTEDAFIERQFAIAKAYENVEFERFDIEIENKGLANAILMENQEMYSLESIEESQTLMIGEFESIMAETELNLVMNALFLEFIEFFSDI